MRLIWSNWKELVYLKNNFPPSGIILIRFAHWRSFGHCSVFIWRVRVDQAPSTGLICCGAWGANAEPFDGPPLLDTRLAQWGRWSVNHGGSLAPLHSSRAHCGLCCPFSQRGYVPLGHCLPPSQWLPPLSLSHWWDCVSCHCVAHLIRNHSTEPLIHKFTFGNVLWIQFFF